MAVIIQIRRGTAAQWTTTDPILADGEVGYEKDTGKFKFGNGVDNWVDLDYATAGGGNIAGGTFTGEFNVSGGNNVFYDDYEGASVVNLSLSSEKDFGSIATVRIRGDKTGTVPTTWNLSGQPITDNASKWNELTLLYVADDDVRIVNRVVDYVDTEAPTVPQNLALVSKTHNTVNLSWDESTDNIAVTGYKIYVGGVYNKTVETNSGQVTGLTAETSYNFTVSAIDAAENESAQSTALTVVTEVAPVGFETEYQALLDYADTNGYDLPSSTQQEIDNEIVKNLKTEGVWAELDKMYYFQADYTPSSWATNFYRLNWKNPGTFTLTSDSGKEPSWVSGSGFKATAANGEFLKTGYTPSTHASKFTTTNGGIIISLFDAPTTFGNVPIFYGARNANNGQQVFLYNGSNNIIDFRLFSFDTKYSITQNQINAHYHSYKDSGTMKCFRNGANELTQTFNNIGTSALPSYECFALGYNNAGTEQPTLANCGLKYLLVGSKLSTKVQEIYDILNGLYI